MTIEIRVLTLNLHKGFSSFNRKFVLHELREGIRKTEADLVFLQEVIGEHQLHETRWKAWPKKPQYEFLADSIWSDFAYGKNAVYTSGHHGNAILSKYPILAWDNLNISMHSSERRGLLHCRINVQGKTLHALCIHFGLLEKFRKSQFEFLKVQVLSKIPENEAVIVAGDFNDWRNRAKERLSKDLGFVEASEALRGRLSLTFPSFFPLLPLDRIYIKNLEPVADISIQQKELSRLSDHRPLCVQVRLA